MPIIVDWDNAEHTILRLDFVNAWNWDDMAASQKQAREEIEGVPYTVNFIADLSLSARLPTNALGNIRTSSRFNPSNTGWIVLVGTGMMVRSIVEIFQRVVPAEGARFIFADTLEQARVILAKVDQYPVKK